MSVEQSGQLSAVSYQPENVTPKLSGFHLFWLTADG
jgi:hypothetical protein